MVGCLASLVFSLQLSHAGEIHEAAGAGDLGRTKAIVGNNPKSVAAKDPYGMTPIHWAVASGHIEVVRLLLARGSNVNAADGEGLTPLHLAAKSGNKAIAEILITAGADVNATNNIQHVSPLNKAAQNGKFEVVKLLVEKAADLNSEEKCGRCPIQCAAGQNGEMAKYLIAHGAKVDLFTAIQLDDMTNVTAMLVADPSLLNKRKPEGITPLYWAVMHGKRDIAKLLISRHADVNGKDDHGLTPLHQAAWHGDAKMAEMLLSEGANPNAMNSSAQSPLNLAEMLHHTNVVLILRQKDARKQDCVSRSNNRACP